MWYEMSVCFESSKELVPGDFKSLDFARDFTNSLETMGIPVKYLDRMSLEQVRTEQESRLAHPSNNPL